MSEELNLKKEEPASRRQFIKQTALTAAGFMIIPRFVLGRGFVAPSDRLTIAGIGVPNAIRPYINDGVIKDAVLWSPVDIGYAAIYITKAQLDGSFDPAKGVVKAGRLGDLKFTAKDEVLLGPPLVFNKDNIEKYNF